MEKKKVFQVLMEVVTIDTNETKFKNIIGTIEELEGHFGLIFNYPHCAGVESVQKTGFRTIKSFLKSLNEAYSYKNAVAHQTTKVTLIENEDEKDTNQLTIIANQEICFG